jgi:type II secretory pathway predicted ATPase ExeA
MRHQHPANTSSVSGSSPGQDPGSVFLTDSYRTALDRLAKSLQDDRPLAILLGEGKSASSFVIGQFITSLDADVVVVRIAEPSTSATDLMRQIVAAVGFKPNAMGATDLESIFRLFLSFQKGHARRTLICIEEIQDSEWWVLDMVRKLVELEYEGNFGLMVVISGQPSLTELLRSRPLSSICAQAGQRISLAPFTLTETTEYMRRRVEAAGNGALDQLFQYHATTLIHELCAGIPDAISALISECRDLADQEGLELVTTELVHRAYDEVRAASGPPAAGTEAATVNLNGVQPFGRLIIQVKGQDVKEKAMRQGHILIGRSKLCDICIDSPVVSRHHALISYSSGGATLVDLSSTNGTFVDGYPIREHQLLAGESITVGDCKIEYVLDDELQGRFQQDPTSSGIRLRPLGI